MTDPVRRVHFFAGQRLTPEDLQAEQDYHRRMRYLHNRLLGHGVVEGLDVTSEDGSTVVVGPGVAIDRCGHELVLTEAVRLQVVADSDAIGSMAIVATWSEEASGFLPPTEEGSDDQSFTRWLERPHLALVADGPAADAVILGRVVLSGGAISALDLDARDRWRRAKWYARGEGGDHHGDTPDRQQG